jgi:DNA-directed RNA polymerase specialized sigma sub unit, sigma24 homolog
MLRAIVDQARQGDEEAFAALVRQVGDRCIFIAHRILRDANLAEDAVQVALVQVWRELPALRDLDRFEAWLHRILVNACRDRLRKRRRSPIAELSMAESSAMPDRYRAVDDRLALDRAFERLSADQAITVVLRYHVDLTLEDVAVRMGVPVGTVKSRLHAALAILATALSGLEVIEL